MGPLVGSIYGKWTGDFIARLKQARSGAHTRIKMAPGPVGRTITT